MTTKRPRDLLGIRLVRKAYVRGPVSELKNGRVPKVSIVISCYNYGRFLPGSIGSALAQEGVEPEVIVVDDASTDDSTAVAQGFADAYPQVKVLHRRQNDGAVIAFNDGYAATTGEFIVRLDADDLLTPGSLARSVALFDTFPSVGLVYGHPRHFAAKIPPEPRAGPARSWSIWPGVHWIAERCRRGYNVITTPEAIVRASVMKQIGPLNPKLRIAHDMEMWLRAAAVSDVGRVNGPDQALHRDHTASLTHGMSRVGELSELRAAFATFFDGPWGRLPESDKLHEAAKRALARGALEEACRAYDRGRTRAVDVDGYVEFALGTYTRAKELPEWRALERRRWVGAVAAPYMPIFYPRIIRRGLQYRFGYHRWTRTGL